jgi:hypothetical protein
MILLLLLTAQAAAPAPDAPAAPAPRQRVCRQAPGSDAVVCELKTPQPSGFRLPKYGPAAPTAQSASGNGVKVRAQASNRGSARRQRPTAPGGSTI